MVKKLSWSFRTGVSTLTGAIIQLWEMTRRQIASVILQHLEETNEKLRWKIENFFFFFFHSAFFDTLLLLCLQWEQSRVGAQWLRREAANHKCCPPSSTHPPTYPHSRPLEIIYRVWDQQCWAGCLHISPSSPANRLYSLVVWWKKCKASSSRQQRQCRLKTATSALLYGKFDPFSVISFRNSIWKLR